MAVVGQLDVQLYQQTEGNKELFLNGSLSAVPYSKLELFPLLLLTSVYQCIVLLLVCPEKDDVIYHEMFLWFPRMNHSTAQGQWSSSLRFTFFSIFLSVCVFLTYNPSNAFLILHTKKSHFFFQNPNIWLYSGYINSFHTFKFASHYCSFIYDSSTASLQPFLHCFTNKIL